MKMRLEWLVAGALGLTVCAGTAMAQTISIVPHNGAQEMIDDLGGNVPPWGLPLSLTGYSSYGVTGTAPDLVLTPGTYAFTYIGKGNSIDSDSFVVSGLGGFTINSSTALGTTFDYTVSSAGDLSFTYHNLTAGTSIVDSAVAPSTSLSYGLFMQGSTGCTTASPDNGFVCPGGSPLTGPGTSAYIGLTDRSLGTDHDFQDLGIRVTAIPEPVTWAMMLLGFGGVGAMLRSQRRRQVLSLA